MKTKISILLVLLLTVSSFAQYEMVVQLKGSGTGGAPAPEGLAAPTNVVASGLSPLLGPERIVNGTFTSTFVPWYEQPSVSILKHYATDYRGVGRVNVALDSASTTVNVRFLQSFTDSLDAGITYRITFEYYIPSSNTYTNGIECLIYTGANANIVGGLHTTLNAWTKVTADVTMPDVKPNIRFRHIDDTSTTLGGTGDVIFIDNVSVKEVLVTP